MHPKSAQRPTQSPPRRLKASPKEPQSLPKRAQRTPKVTPKVPQRSPKKSKTTPKVPKEGPKLPDAPKEAKKIVLGSFKGAKISPDLLICLLQMRGGGD